MESTLIYDIEFCAILLQIKRRVKGTEMGLYTRMQQIIIVQEKFKKNKNKREIYTKNLSIYKIL